MTLGVTFPRPRPTSSIVCRLRDNFLLGFLVFIPTMADYIESFICETDSISCNNGSPTGRGRNDGNNVGKPCWREENSLVPG